MPPFSILYFKKAGNKKARLLGRAYPFLTQE